MNISEAMLPARDAGNMLLAAWVVTGVAALVLAYAAATSFKEFGRRKSWAAAAATLVGVVGIVLGFIQLDTVRGDLMDTVQRAAGERYDAAFTEPFLQFGSGTTSLGESSYVDVSSVTEKVWLGLAPDGSLLLLRPDGSELPRR